MPLAKMELARLDQESWIFIGGNADGGGGGAGGGGAAFKMSAFKLANTSSRET